MITQIGCGAIRFLCGATANWVGCAPEPKQRIYFANHSSHLDFLVIWSSLPSELRAVTRPVAGRDYWERGVGRPFLAEKVFRAILIERVKVTKSNNPLRTMLAALEQGDSLIIFPEGTRSADGSIHRFKDGLHHLRRRAKGVEFIPVYLNNLNRILPKGEFLPLPMLSSVSFGTPLPILADEPKADFLRRAQQAILDLEQP
jgi:1-acyl-sn-glycerol-3-phosphate acyltransferase